MRVAIYVRCAASEPASFAEQREHCLSYATQEGHAVTAVYEDFNCSGLDTQIVPAYRPCLPGLNQAHLKVLSWNAHIASDSRQ